MTEHPAYENFRRRQAPRRRRRTWLQIAGLVIGIIFGVGLFDRVLMPLVVWRGTDAAVPNLRGLSRDKAEGVLSRSRLQVGEVIEVPDPDVHTGGVVAQEPSAKSLVRRGRRVNLVVSTGTPIRRVPDLAGRSIRSAGIELSQLDLRAGTETVVPSSSLPQGEILATRPPQGLAPGAEGVVDLLLSGGPRRALYVMPDLRGLQREDAVARLESVGILAETSQSSGRVRNQTPGPGEPVWSGDRVSLD